MRWIARGAIMALGIGAIAVAPAGEAAATPSTTKHLTPARHVAHPAPGKRPAAFGTTAAKLPPKYTVVTSAPFASPANTQSNGSATCPAKTVVYGGGVFFSSGSTAGNVNSSYPRDTTSWTAFVNNGTGSDSSFVVYAVCVKRNASWTIVTGATVSNGPGSQTPATATCPAGDKVLSGGGFSSSLSTLSNENSTYPTRSGTGHAAVYGWAVFQNNGSADGDAVHAYAVCGHVTGYTQAAGALTTNAAGAQTESTVGCPTHTVPLGGGMFSSSLSTAVNLNTSYPTSTGWAAFENNASSGTATMTTYVICGK